MNNKAITFLGITAIVFACCYLYHEVYPHVAGQILISFYSDIKMIVSGKVPSGYPVTADQTARMNQFLFLTNVIKVLLALIFSSFGTIGILFFQKRIKGI